MYFFIEIKLLISQLFANSTSARVFVEKIAAFEKSQKTHPENFCLGLKHFILGCSPSVKNPYGENV